MTTADAAPDPAGPLLVVAAVVAVLVTQWPRRREARTGGAP
ncbi:MULTISPECIES: hypothetical protein [unclassified Streptomyces]|nr:MULTISPECIES: hypothetical protein [unclassified Streptomyces]MCZ7413932.1 hypothetical protein [Streptomyces sp. WMMC897]MCZ7430928.1 hypothetical protein [Streptomyces sp. WMMC1477]